MKAQAVVLALVSVVAIDFGLACAEGPTNRVNLRGHDGAVESVAFSPDGSTLASSSDDHTIKLWNLRTGKCTSTLRGHTSMVYSVCYSSDGRMILTGSADRTVKLWEVATGKPRLDIMCRHGVYTVAISPDQKIFASAVERQLDLWSVATGEKITVLKGHTMSIVALAFSPDSKALASGSHDGTTKLWDIESLALRATIQEPVGEGRSITFSPNSKTLVTGGMDATIKMWDVATGRNKGTFKGHSSRVTGLAFSPDGRMLASAGWDTNGKLWEVGTGKERAEFPARFFAHFSPDGRTIVTVSPDYSVISLLDVYPNP